jgi:hypothetical protein
MGVPDASGERDALGERHGLSRRQPPVRSNQHAEMGNASGSTLMRKLDAGDLAGAAEQFLLWDKAGGKVMLGLKRRRTAERALFLGKAGAEAVAIGQAVQA